MRRWQVVRGRLLSPDTRRSEAAWTIAGRREAIAGCRGTIAGSRDAIAGSRGTIAGSRDAIAGPRVTIAGSGMRFRPPVTIPTAFRVSEALKLPSRTCDSPSGDRSGQWRSRGFCVRAFRVISTETGRVPPKLRSACARGSDNCDGLARFPTSCRENSGPAAPRPRRVDESHCEENRTPARTASHGPRPHSA